MTVAVVGAGIFGASAALELAIRGHRVTLFDADQIPSWKASSSDVSKAIRRVWYVGEMACYVDLVERSADRWSSWERATRRQVLHRTGHLSILRQAENKKLLCECLQVLRRRGAAEVQELDPPALRRRFPLFQVADDEVGVYDPWGGYLESTAAVRMVIDLASDAGVTVHERTPIAAVDEDIGAATVLVKGVKRKFDSVVVSVGAWIDRLLPELAGRLTVTRQEMVLLSPPDPGRFSYPQVPTWATDPGGESWYGFPLLREGCVKVARDRLGLEADPDVDRSGTSTFRADVEAMLQRRIPLLGDMKGARGRSCLYTMAPDTHFIIDRIPGSERLVVAGAGSGHAFKFGGVLGTLVAALVEGRPERAGDPFRIANRLRVARNDGLSAN